MERHRDFSVNFPLRSLESVRAPLVFELPVRQPIDKCKMVFVPLWQWNIKKLRSFVNQCAMASACKTVFAKFTKVRGIHRSIYK
jgi:hypothetical protein